MEYVKKAGNTSTTAKVAAALGGTALGLQVLGNGGNGVLGALFGNPARFGYPMPTGYPQQFAPPMFAPDPHQGGYVTEKEMSLLREIGRKDAELAQERSERYAESAVVAATEPLKNRICDLETAQAVNAARDQDFRHYVEREFVHQPKASIKESIVVCRQCGCECESDRRC